MIAIVGGLGAAACWATSLLSASRSSRSIGAWSTLAWVMIVGLVLVLPAIAAAGPVELGPERLLLLVVAGASNVAGLLVVYTALRVGKVAVIGPIVSTEGAIGAVIAVLMGEPMDAVAIVILAAIVVGVALAATKGPAEPGDDEGRPAGPVARTAALALTGAVCFGVNLYVSGRIAVELPLAWAILPARLAGVLFVALPLLVARRLRLTRRAAPFVLVIGVAEVVGLGSFAFGSRDGIAVASVLSSQFAGIAAVAAFVLFRERLSRRQAAGVATIVLGVAVLAWLRA